jgi:hypothetical protein
MQKTLATNTAKELKLGAEAAQTPVWENAPSTHVKAGSKIGIF